MGISVLSIVFLLLIAPTSIKVQARSAQCSHGGPRIKFPFQLQQDHGQVSQRGLPGFNLSCEGNATRIHFQSYESLAVKFISYDQKRLDLADLNGCVHGVFLKLNLSLTPFRYFYVVKDYLYLNCTARLPSSSSTEVPCLSQPGAYVYVVRPPLMAAPRFCRAVKTVGIPFEYSAYLDDGSFGLTLTWGLDQTKTGCQTGCFLKATNHQVLSISLLAAMVAISMVIMKIYHSKKQDYPKEEADKKLFEHSYEALKNEPQDSANHQLV